MYKFVRSILFLFPAELAHYLALDILKWLFKIPGLDDLLSIFFSPPNTKPIPLCGLSFSNRVGLAAGLDKNAKYISELAFFGFGHIEIGTVTPLPQAGNPRPRLFRIKSEQAIINRMGFNNEGVEEVAKRLLNRPKNLIIGGNIGKNKDTPNHKAIDDYTICFNRLHDKVDYFVINVSSPNTPGLRALQEKEPLMYILTALQALNQALEKPKPLFLKVAPDLTDEQIKDIAEIVHTTRLTGLIVSNTTIDRTMLKTDLTILDGVGAGGLSGAPLKTKSTYVLSQFRALLPHAVIIGVGGIMSAQDAKEKIEAGADLVQLYTGFVYTGPSLVTDAIASTSLARSSTAL